MKRVAISQHGTSVLFKSHLIQNKAQNHICRCTTNIIVYVKCFSFKIGECMGDRGVATVRHFRHVPTHNFFPKFVLLMKNDKQRITYFNYVCFMFIVLMTSLHKLKDKHLQ